MFELTIAEILDRYRTGVMTSRQLVEYYLERIAAIDRAGPSLNAIIELNPQAQKQAERCDQERKAGEAQGALHGIPIVLKDNIDTADEMSTTAGSLALQGHRPDQDAFLVGRLRAAGAIILGKANLSEWANFRSSRSSSGWSSRGGQTRNPYVLDRNPCGSSSGSAVAVAADLCTVAVGTETDGSIVGPSHANGIVGLKPTLGLVSRAGVIPISHSQDTAGPMGRSVADVAALLGAMTGVDPADSATAASQGHAFIDYTQFIDTNGLKGARLGVARNYFGTNPDTDAIIEAAIEQMRQLGATIIDPASLDIADFGKAEMEVLFYDFKADLDAYLSRLGPEAAVHSLQEVIAFNEAHQAQVMPYFGQERMLVAAKKGPLTQKRYHNARERCLRLAQREGLDQVFSKHNLDALIAPTGCPAWLTDWVNGDHPAGPDTSSPPAVAGYPHLTLPAGYVHGLPVGISFIGLAWQEPKLLRLAYAFEQANQVRRPPQYLPTIDFKSVS
jgi:amidase